MLEMTSRTLARPTENGERKHVIFAPKLRLGAEDAREVNLEMPANTGRTRHKEKPGEYSGLR